jgi:hypothetical protein
VAISFPTSLDNFTNPSSGNTLDSPSHSLQHSDINDAVEAMQRKVGVGTAVAGSASAGQVLTISAAGTSTWSTPDSGGLVLISTTSWTTQSSVTLSTGTAYTHFRLVVSHQGSSVDSDAFLRVSLNGTPSTAVQYNSAVLGLTNSNGTTNLTGTLSGYKYATNESTTNEYGGFTFDLIDLNVARFTKIVSIGTQVSSAGAVSTFTGASLHDIATAYNEVVLLPSTGTFSGRASIYGYKS